MRASVVRWWWQISRKFPGTPSRKTRPGTRPGNPSRRPSRYFARDYRNGTFAFGEVLRMVRFCDALLVCAFGWWGRMSWPRLLGACFRIRGFIWKKKLGMFDQWIFISSMLREVCIIMRLRHCSHTHTMPFRLRRLLFVDNMSLYGWCEQVGVGVKYVIRFCAVCVDFLAEVYKRNGSYNYCNTHFLSVFVQSIMSMLLDLNKKINSNRNLIYGINYFLS